ncbi:hypothetical protein [Nesterenkonia pannonica]|nr:hypothetical protein [Nesterenkonia pannonica]
MPVLVEGDRHLIVRLREVLDVQAIGEQSAGLHVHLGDIGEPHEA